jgi:hypothetical protein
MENKWKQPKVHDLWVGFVLTTCVIALLVAIFFVGRSKPRIDVRIEFSEGISANIAKKMALDALRKAGIQRGEFSVRVDKKTVSDSSHVNFCIFDSPRFGACSERSPNNPDKIVADLATKLREMKAQKNIEGAGRKGKLI